MGELYHDAHLIVAISPCKLSRNSPIADEGCSVDDFPRSYSSQNNNQSMHQVLALADESTGGKNLLTDLF